MNRAKWKLARVLSLTAVALLAVVAISSADEVPTFKRKSDDEKKFAGQVGEAIVKAAHKSAKKIGMVEHKFSEPKANRTELKLKMEYFGAVTKKKYLADIVVKIDSTDKAAWEVLRIEYSDNNNVPYNRKHVDELVKQMNK